MNYCGMIVALTVLQFASPRAYGQALFHQRSPVPPPGQISGHVYRTDTGQPLAEVIVTLQDTHAQSPGITRTERTTTDGMYSFIQIAPGSYFVTAYRSGFVGHTYGMDRPYDQPKLLTLGPGQKLEEINLRLSPNPDIIAMVDDALRVAYQGKPSGFGPSRFSPDGKFFAFAAAEQVWIYDLPSQRLVPVTEKPEGALDFQIHDLTWAEDHTVYVDAERIKDQVSRNVLWAATMKESKEITQFPAAVVTAFQRQAASSLSAIPREEHNDRFTLRFEQPCRGCSFRLTISRSDGTGAPVIADLQRNFLFDADRSLVLYPQPGVYGTIVILNLETRQSREIALPVVAQALLAQTRDGNGILLAYIVQGSCEPEESPDGENLWILPGNVRFRREQVRPIRVCFVKIPAEASTRIN